MRFPDTILQGSLISWFVPEPLKGSGSLDEIRARLLILLSFCTASLGPIFSLLFLATGSPLLALPMMGGALAVLTPPILLRLGVSMPLVGNWFSLQTFSSLSAFIVLTGGTQPESLLWLLVAPIAAMLFVGVRSGVAWTAVTILACIGFFLLSSLGVPFPQHLQGSPLISVLGAVTLISLNSFYFVLYSFLQGHLISSIRRQEKELEKAQREALEASRESFQTLIENIPDGVAVLQNDRIVYANPTLTKLLGYSPEELYQVAPEEFLVAEDRTRALTLREQILEQGKLSEDFEGQSRHKNGSRIDIVIRPFLAEFRGQPSLICAIQDITERKQLQAQMAHMDRMAAVGTLAAGVAHEINNPLSFVKSNTDLLLLDHQRGAFENWEPPPETMIHKEELGEVLGDIAEGAERIGQVVADLRTYAREDFGKQRDDAVDLTALLTSVLKMAQHEIKHRAQLITEFDCQEPVEGDASELGQLFLNLVINAAQSIPHGARDDNEVRIRTFKKDQFVVVEISDTGAGIPHSLQNRIFDPFFSTKRDDPALQGMGLGLYICQNICRKHGGRLTFESTPGEGTTFRVALASSEKRVKATPVQTPPPDIPALKILVIDDEPQLISAVKRLMKQHHVIGALSGPEALQLLEEEPDIDVVLCDLIMPEMTGMQLYEMLQQTYPNHSEKVVFITGGVSNSPAKSFLENTTRPVLTKPFSTSALQKTIEALLATPAPQPR